MTNNPVEPVLVPLIFRYEFAEGQLRRPCSTSFSAWVSSGWVEILYEKAPEGAFSVISSADLIGAPHRCVATLRAASNGRRIAIAGLVLVRQMPGSAKGVMFITLEDETANANLIVWPSVFEANRRAILAANMLGVWGKVQSAHGVVHLIVEEIKDLTRDLRQVSGLNDDFPLVAGRGDEARHPGGADSRQAAMQKPRDIYVPDLHIDILKLKVRNFR